MSCRTGSCLSCVEAAVVVRVRVRVRVRLLGLGVGVLSALKSHSVII